MARLCRLGALSCVCILMSCAGSKPAAGYPPAQPIPQNSSTRSVPTKCIDGKSCLQDDVTFQEAKDSFPPIEQQVTKCQKLPALPVGKNPEEILHNQLRILMGRGDEIAGSNKCGLHTVTDRDICEDPNEIGLKHGRYYWAPANKFIDGESVLKSLLDRATTGEIVNKTIILDSSEDLAHERRLARCNMRTIAGVAGLPSDCVTVAIIAPAGAWLRGGFDSGFCECAAYIRPSGAIDIRFDIQTKADPQVFADQISKMMAADLGLVIEQTTQKSEGGQVESISIESQAGLRNSKILPAGWREALDFDVEVFKAQDGVNLRGVAHALVCREALGNLSNYQGLDDVQRNAYATALDARVSQAIRAACPTFVAHDAKTVSCN